MDTPLVQSPAPGERSPPAKGAPPRFIVDANVGRLGRWLRLLGYDVVASPWRHDDDLLRLARLQQRVLLTRDTGLARRRPVRRGEGSARLLASDHPRQQLRQVAAELGLRVDRAFSRCLECNDTLEPLDRPLAAGLVPPYVLATQRTFKRCPHCGRVYWRGTHWERMMAEVRDLLPTRASEPGEAGAAARRTCGPPRRPAPSLDRPAAPVD